MINKELTRIYSVCPTCNRTIEKMVSIDYIFWVYEKFTCPDCTTEYLWDTHTKEVTQTFFRPAKIHWVMEFQV